MCNSGLPTPIGKQVQFRKTNCHQIAIFEDFYIKIWHDHHKVHFQLETGARVGMDFFLSYEVSTLSEFMAAFHESSIKAYNLASQLESLITNINITDAGT